MARNEREPLFLLTTVDDTFAEEQITEFVENAGGGAEREDTVQTLLNAWRAAKADGNCAGVSFKRTMVLTATKLDKDGQTIGEPTVLPL